MLCELARTDHRFRLLEPDLDATKAIRGLTRGREDLVGARVALANQLRAELERFWPGPVGLFQRSGQPDLVGVPGSLPQAGGHARAWREATGAFLNAQHYTNRKTAAQAALGAGRTRRRA